MKIFVDTAKIEEIEQAFSWGIVDGVTTNPSLIKKAVDGLKEKGETVNISSYVERICRRAGEHHPVSLEVISLTEEKMYEEAVLLYEKFNHIAGNVVIKIPINTFTQGCTYTHYEGLRTIRKLSSRKIPVNCTLIMSPEQALLAAKAGATYVSPFAGRVDDYIRKGLEIDFAKGDYFNFELIEKIQQQRTSDKINMFEEELGTLYQKNEVMKQIEWGKDKGITGGTHLIASTVQILCTYGMDAQVIASSMRNARQVREVALRGAHIATIPFSVIGEMLQHPKTEEGVRRFAQDVTPEYREIFQK